MKGTEDAAAELQKIIKYGKNIEKHEKENFAQVMLNLFLGLIPGRHSEPSLIRKYWDNYFILLIYNKKRSCCNKFRSNTFPGNWNVMKLSLFFRIRLCLKSPPDIWPCILLALVAIYQHKNNNEHNIVWMSNSLSRLKEIHSNIRNSS